MSSSSGRIPALFGEYQVQRVIARGGMGAVFEVRHRSTGARCAAKTLLKSTSPHSRERFRREAELLARCDRIPGVVKVHSFGETPQGDLFMILDFIDGPSLDSRLGDGGRLEPRDAAVLVRDVARALGACHSKGVIHRDVKPGNILLDPHAKPWLTDFGLAAARDLDRLTRTGAFVGTVSYAAPEQAGGEPCTAASDVFSLGCVLFHALAGETPIESDSAVSHMAQLTSPVPIRDVRTVRQGIPLPLAWIVSRCLEKEPVHRYRTGEHLARDLDRFLEGKDIEGSAKRRRKSLAIGSVLLLAIVLVLGFVLREHEDKHDHGSAARRPVTLDEWEQDGDAHLAAGDVAAADQSYQTALRLAAPTRAKPLHQKRAAALATLGKDDEALSEIHAVYPELERVQGRAENQLLAGAAPALYRRGLAKKEAKLLEAAWRMGPPPRELELEASVFWKEQAAAGAERWAQDFIASFDASEKPLHAVCDILEPAARTRASGVRFFKGGFASAALGLIRGWVRNQHEAISERLGRRLVHDWPDESFSLYVLAYSRRKSEGASLDEGGAWVRAALDKLPDAGKDDDDEQKRLASALVVLENELLVVPLGPSDLDRAIRATKLGDHADAWLHLGMFLRDARRMDESDAAFDKAEERPDISNGFFRPSQIEGERIANLVVRGKRAEGLERARALAAHSNGLPDAVLAFARLEAWEDIVTVLDKGRADTDDLVYWNAMALGWVGRGDDARKAIPRLEGKYPDRVKNIENAIAKKK